MCPRVRFRPGVRERGPGPSSWKEGPASLGLSQQEPGSREWPQIRESRPGCLRNCAPGAFLLEAMSSPGSSLVLGGAAVSLPPSLILQPRKLRRTPSGDAGWPAGTEPPAEGKRNHSWREERECGEGGGEAWNNSTLPQSVRGVGKARTDAGGERASIRIWWALVPSQRPCAPLVWAPRWEQTPGAEVRAAQVLLDGVRRCPGWCQPAICSFPIVTPGVAGARF